MKRFLILLLACASTACSTQGTQQADKAVAQFHTRYNHAQFAEIYSSADTALKSVSPQKDFIEFIAAMHRKLGKVKSTTRTASGVNIGTFGTRVSLTYQTEFEQGAGVEQFNWQVHGDEARLLGYNINSPDLVVK